MNFERMATPIEGRSENEKERELERRLAQIQFYYADRKYEQEREENPEITFGEIVVRDTAIDNVLWDRYHDTLDWEVDEETHERQRDEIKKYVAGFIAKINEIHGSVRDEEMLEDTLTNVFEEQITELTAKRVEGKSEESSNKGGRAGLIEYEKRVKTDSVMAEAGFGEDDEFLQIHFPDFFKSKDETLTPVAIKESFVKLAGVVVEKFPEAQAIIGHSWLLAHPIAEKLGFAKIVGDGNEPMNSFATWAQFIDKNGEVSKKRLKEFVKTGAPPYGVVRGFIPIERFLEKYASPELRERSVVLKRNKPGFEAKIREFKDYYSELKKLKNSYGDFAKNTDLSADDFIASFPAIRSMMEKLGGLKGVIEGLNEAKGKGLISVDDAGKIFDSHLVGIREKFLAAEKAAKADRYENYEVVLEKA